MCRTGQKEDAPNVPAGLGTVKTCLHHLEEIEFEVTGLLHAPEDGVVAALLPGLDLPELDAGVFCRVVEHGDEFFLRGEVGAGAGGQQAAARQQPHGPVVDLLVAGQGVGDGFAGLGEGRGIQDDEVILGGLLGKLGDKGAINAAAAYLGSGIYQLYRHFYRAAGANERYFSLPADACMMDAGEADRKLSELRYVRALESQGAESFPDLSPEALNAAYPGQNQSLTQVLSTADARLSGLTEKNG
mgnify:CR=1 FL=1